MKELELSGSIHAIMVVVLTCHYTMSFFSTLSLSNAHAGKRSSRLAHPPAAFETARSRLPHLAAVRICPVHLASLFYVLILASPQEEVRTFDRDLFARHTFALCPSHADPLTDKHNRNPPRFLPALVGVHGSRLAVEART